MLEKIKIYRKWILLGLAVLFLLFLDENNFYRQYKLKKELNRLKAKEQFYNTEIDKMEKEKERIFENKKELEKYGREKYLMKKDNEDIFVFPDEK